MYLLTGSSGSDSTDPRGKIPAMTAGVEGGMMPPPTELAGSRSRLVEEDLKRRLEHIPQVIVASICITI
jgi:hypothetical protein